MTIETTETRLEQLQQTENTDNCVASLDSLVAKDAFDSLETSDLTSSVVHRARQRTLIRYMTQVSAEYKLLGMGHMTPMKIRDLVTRLAPEDLQQRLATWIDYKTGNKG